MNLCAICKESLTWTAAQSDPSLPSSKNHHPTHRDWMQAIEQGCILFILLHDALQPGVAARLEKLAPGILKHTAWPMDESFDAFLIWTKLAISHDYPNVRVSLEFNASTTGLKGPPREPTDVILVELDLDHGSVANPVSLQGNPSSDSRTAWSLMRYWISQCKQKHLDDSLRTGVAGLWYPTRLLDLGHLESISTPRLIETANNLPQGPYLTLSHCWGKKQLICATKENLQHLYNGVYNLPQTFQDAIAATKNLGYHYLWVDSLCIVQNDQEDWAREAALMHRVYTEADCNLAAAASQDSSEGLCFKRKGLYGQCVVRNVRGDVIDLFADEDLFLKEVNRSPLQTRAWVYQEWLMSKRTIHFAKSQVFWECDHLCACEVFPDGLPNTIRHDGKAKFAEDLGNAKCLLNRDVNANTSRVGPDPFELWSGLITHYTSRDMTKSNDRLPALSGIAKWLQPHLGNPRHLAGLWNNNDLVRQLAWYSCTTKNPRPQYRAPSWSWASIDGPIFWINPPGYFTPHSKIIDISTTPSSSDPTGPVTGGYILIQGTMGRVQIIDHKTGLVLHREDNVKEAYKRHVTIRGFDVRGLKFGLYYVLHLGTYTIQPNKIHSSPSADYLFATHLVLRSVVGQHGTFERCGLVDEHCPEDGEYRTLAGRGPQSRQDIPCKEYGEYEGNCRIRII
ncbi:heterokaryon incompatibility protein [Fusarium phyllophilum]|uniref:Heterokaryon incompatibility protein n=1 Tax=Fusarium phyllophilum TaxID=47803 RepID=A0A8H5MYE7_9HYPO|nr:heterokaryon incompatibility protein [Fusarium phyllophilum]